MLNCLIGCAQKTNKVVIENQCKLIENEIDIKNLSSNETDIVNLELINYYNSNSIFDVLYFTVSEGSNFGQLERWYINEKNICSHIIISNNIKKENHIIFNEEDKNIALINVEKKSFIQLCDNCYDCKNSILMIKKNDIIFKLSTNNQFLEVINEKTDERLYKYLKLIKYLKEKS